MSRLVQVLRHLAPLQRRAELGGLSVARRAELSSERILRHSVLCNTAAPFQSSLRHRCTTTPTEEGVGQRSFLFETQGCSRHRHSSQQEKAKLVIFDKDGTLICFHSMWSSWAVKVTEGIARMVDLDIEGKVYETLGVCAQTKRVFPGLLAEKTTPIIQDELVKLLLSEGVSESLAWKAVTESWSEGDSGKGGDQVQSIHPDLLSLFKILKANDMKIAVCTADNRRGSLNTLRHMGLMPYVDMVVCGDDPGTEAKPSPHNAWKICEELGVDPNDAVMVGDTKADMGMGHAAKLGWNVGVLSGVGDTAELLPEAHYVIDNVKDLLPLIMPHSDWVNYYTYSTYERVLQPPVDTTEDGAGQRHSIAMENYDLVIFDLHGTLVCAHKKFMLWVEKLTSRLETKTGLQLGRLIDEHLGVSRQSKKVRQGVLSNGDHESLKEALVQMLRQEGFHFEEALITINQAWQDCEDHMESSDSIIALDKDMEQLFLTLKENGVKIAINTMDSRQSAIHDLRSVGLLPYVDMMVCGDDPMSRLKPSPHNCQLICEEMSTSPERAVIVGDTMEDISMGLNAKLGLTCGVLTGVGARSDLIQADHICETVSQILSHMASDSTPRSSSPSRHLPRNRSASRLFSTRAGTWSTAPRREYSTGAEKRYQTD